MNSIMSVGSHMNMCLLVQTAVSYTFKKYESWELTFPPIGFAWGDGQEAILNVNSEVNTGILYR